MSSTRPNTQTRMEINQHEQEPAETPPKTDPLRLQMMRLSQIRYNKSLEITAGSPELNNGLADRKEKNPHGWAKQQTTHN